MWIKGVHAVPSKLADGTRIYYYYTKRGKGRKRFWPPKGETCTKDFRVKGPFPNGFIQSYQRMIEKTPDVEGDVAQLIVDYLDSEHMPNSQARRKEIDYYQKILRDQFGKTSAQAAQHPRFRKILRKWRQQRFSHSPRQGDLAIGLLSTILQLAVDDGELTVNRASRMKKMYVAPDDKKPIPPQDLETVLASAKPHVRDMLLLGSYTGMRAADLAVVSWSHDKGDRIEIMTSKSGRKRLARIPLTSEARSFIDGLKRRQIEAHGLQARMLLGQKGRPVTPKTVTRYISNAFKEHGMEHTAHRFRNTYVTNMVKIGFKFEEIGLAVGWSPDTVEEMIRVYVDVDQVVSAAIARMERKDD